MLMGAVLSMLADVGKENPGDHCKDEHDPGADYCRDRSSKALGNGTGQQCSHSIGTIHYHGIYARYPATKGIGNLGLN